MITFVLPFNLALFWLNFFIVVACQCLVLYSPSPEFLVLPCPFLSSGAGRLGGRGKGGGTPAYIYTIYFKLNRTMFAVEPSLNVITLEPYKRSPPPPRLFCLVASPRKDGL